MILLDTHVWIWWHADAARLSRRARTCLADADQVAIAAISMWELSMLASRGRLTLDRDPLVWMRQALAQPRSVLLPLSPEVAAASASLTAHGDPADRLILATALVHRARLVTKDQQMRKSANVETVW